MSYVFVVEKSLKQGKFKYVNVGPENVYFLLQIFSRTCNMFNISPVLRTKVPSNTFDMLVISQFFKGFVDKTI